MKYEMDVLIEEYIQVGGRVRRSRVIGGFDEDNGTGSYNCYARVTC